VESRRERAGLPVRLKRVSAVASIVACALGAIVLLGWITGLELLKSGLPGFAAMKVNAALAFIATGTALWLVKDGEFGARARVVSRALVAGVAVLATLTLLEWVLGDDLGIDQLLVTEPAGAVGTTVAGRMAASTALAFMFLAAAVGVLTLHRQPSPWLTPALSMGAGIPALIAVVGYVTGTPWFYGISQANQMAVPTAVGLFALTAAVFCHHPHVGPMRLIVSDTAGGRAIRVLFPAALCVPPLLGALHFVGESNGLYSTDTGAWLLVLVVITVLVPLTWGLAASLDRTERALQDADESQRTRVAFDEAPIGSALGFVDGRLERVNAALGTMLGYAPEELVGRHFDLLTHPDDRAASLASITRLLAGPGRHLRYEKRYLHRSGDAVHAIVDLTAIYDEYGSVSRLYEQVQDLTKSRLAASSLEEAQFEIVARLGAAAEYRDNDTAEHTRRVGDLSAVLAVRLGVSEEHARLVRLAAPLHDVGKISTSDAILLKPGKLTAEEFEHMKAHTTVGAQILSGGTFPLMELARQIALTHHEHYDGRGYPRGLRGDEIPLEGRIVAVADVFDALTHVRPYKAAWKVDEALAEIEAQRGRQFDPDVVDALVGALDTYLECETLTIGSPIAAGSSAFRPDQAQRS
jgi:PAS domain S-box-containing protein/putative nucleotidyltransferase with HDIG domain